MSNANQDESTAGGRWLTQACAARLVEVLESMTGERPGVECVQTPRPGMPSETEETFWWEQCLSLSPEPLVWVGAPKATWSELGGRTLRAAGVEDADPSDLRGTFQELLQQTLGALAHAVGGRLQSEVVCTSGREIPAAPQQPPEGIEVRFAGASPLQLLVAFSPLFDKAFEAAAASGPVAPETAGLAPAPGPSAGLPEQGTMQLLLDVELPVSISFGRSNLPLKDVLKLTSGSIVELNRSVSDPVEVIVNNCVIARAEVVVVDGNYGVRISHIVSRQERLRTLN